MRVYGEVTLPLIWYRVSHFLARTVTLDRHPVQGDIAIQGLANHSGRSDVRMADIRRISQGGYPADGGMFAGRNHFWPDCRQPETGHFKKHGINMMI